MYCSPWALIHVRVCVCRAISQWPPVGTNMVSWITTQSTASPPRLNSFPCPSCVSPRRGTASPHLQVWHFLCLRLLRKSLKNGRIFKQMCIYDNKSSKKPSCVSFVQCDRWLLVWSHWVKHMRKKISSVICFGDCKVLLWHVPGSPSPSRPYDCPAENDNCGYRCSSRGPMHTGGCLLPPPSLPDGKRTQDSLYAGNVKHQVIWLYSLYF